MNKNLSLTSRAVIYNNKVDYKTYVHLPFSRVCLFFKRSIIEVRGDIVRYTIFRAHSTSTLFNLRMTFLGPQAIYLQ